MDTFKKWMVCLDMSLTDHFIINNVKDLTQKFYPESIDFVHIVDKPDLPAEVLQDIPDLQLPQIDFFRTKVHEIVNDKFGKDIEIKIHVKEGNPFADLLRHSNKTKADLVILGRKERSFGNTIKRLARKSPCSLLIVPEKPVKKIDSIVVPIDFSSYSDMAFQIGHKIATKHETDRINVIHVYKDSSKYLNQVFETAHEIEKILSKKSAIDQKLKHYADHKLKNYLGKFDFIESKVASHTIDIQHGEEIGEAIHQWVTKNKTDMVVIGAKGQTSLKAALMGSVSEQVYSKETDVLLLLVRRKGENVSLLKVLLGSQK